MNCGNYSSCTITLLHWQQHMNNHTYSLTVNLFVNTHLTPASSWCPQLCWPIVRWGHVTSLVSLPPQDTSSRRIWPLPRPNRAKVNARTPEAQNHSHQCLNLNSGQVWLHFPLAPILSSSPVIFTHFSFLPNKSSVMSFQELWIGKVTVVQIYQSDK